MFLISQFILSITIWPETIIPLSPSHIFSRQKKEEEEEEEKETTHVLFSLREVKEDFFSFYVFLFSLCL